MAAKGPSRSHAPKGGDVPNDPVSQKPLTATLLQEFQNLKDKFKNDDDVQEKGAACDLLYTLVHTVSSNLESYFLLIFASPFENLFRVPISAFGKSHSFARMQSFPRRFSRDSESS